MKRNPNNYGTVTKLSGNRAKPFVALMPIYNDNGKPRRKAIGYYESREEALQALADWNRYGSVDAGTSFEELYKQWKQTADYTKLSHSTQNGYDNGYKRLSLIHNRRLRDIKTVHFQQCVDEADKQGLSRTAIANMIIVANAVEKLAVQNDIIAKNYAQFVVIPKQQEAIKEPFSSAQIKKIRADADAGNSIASIIYLLIGTGWRINEFLSMTVKDYDPELKTLTGGLKTEAGTNRTVPIPSALQPYFDAFYNKADNLIFPIATSTFEKRFGEYITSANLRAKKSEKFTPHSCRHTFASLAYKYKVDELALKRMMGHNVKNDVTKTVYIHITTNQLRAEIEKIDFSKC